MHVVADTNVLVVANLPRPAAQVSASCIDTCVDKLEEIKANHTLVLDSNRLILGEYERQGLTKVIGPGLAFMKWLYSNLFTERCERVDITPTPDGSFAEFPADEAARKFDLSDHKFVAVALKYEQEHQVKVTIYNATDTDWAQHYATLAKYVQIEFLCSDAVPHP
jgi:hypothetical protein